MLNFFYECTLIVLRTINTSIYLEFRVFDAMFNYLEHLKKIIRINVYFSKDIVLKTCNIESFDKACEILFENKRIRRYVIQFR